MASVRLGCVPEIRLQQLLSFKGALCAREPDLRVDVTHLSVPEQVERLTSGELDLGLTHRFNGASRIEQEPLFPGERVAAFLPVGHRLEAKPVIGARDFDGELLLLCARSANPVVHDRLRELTDHDSFALRGVREAGGTDPRDVLLAVGEGGAITLGQASMLQIAAEFQTIVRRRLLVPPEWMPDITVAWAAAPRRPLAPLAARVREVARQLYRQSSR